MKYCTALNTVNDISHLIYICKQTVVVTEVKIYIMFLQVITPRCTEGDYRRFGGTYCLHFAPKYLQSHTILQCVIIQKQQPESIQSKHNNYTCPWIITTLYLCDHYWRHCATSQKVGGSIPDGVIGIFHWHNPSGRTVALRSTQPLTEMSTGNISWG